MDIRDFKSQPVPDFGEYPMELIFDLQKNLLNYYIGIEKLPRYPIDIDIRENQIILKDFIARVTEELGEGYESLDKLNKVVQEYGLKTDEDFIVNSIQNFNEEIADAIHFMVETMIFVNITPESLLEYGKGLYREYLKDVDSKDAFTDALYLAFFIGKKKLKKLYMPFDFSGYQLLPNNPLLFLAGGRLISTKMQTILATDMWEVTYHLQIARNALKNKPWKQSEMQSDLRVFVEALVRAWYSMGMIFESHGFNVDSVVEIYYRKNLVNQFRIKSKY